MRQFAPAAERNGSVIAGVLERELPPTGLVLEVASGTGQHAASFACRFPALQWQPSDNDAEALESIEAWRAEAVADNLLPPVRLDAASDAWPLHSADAVLCINMVHISPWEATEGLFAGAARLLEPGAPLILYGPYREGGTTTAPSNERFDESLKAQNSRWGLREVENVDEVAAATGFLRKARYAMPANNLILAYRRQG